VDIVPDAAVHKAAVVLGQMEDQLGIDLDKDLKLKSNIVNKPFS
jgi:hypothetical protein